MQLTVGFSNTLFWKTLIVDLGSDLIKGIRMREVNQASSEGAVLQKWVVLKTRWRRVDIGSNPSVKRWTGTA